MLNLGFDLLLHFSFNPLALHLLTSFRPLLFSYSFTFVLVQRLCFFDCPFTAILMSKFLESHQKNSSAIVQCQIVLVSSGFDGSSIPLLMFSFGIYILPSYILIAFCML